MKNQENMTAPKDHNNLPGTDPKDIYTQYTQYTQKRIQNSCFDKVQ